jgi:outer membrane receptor protein involved in Fe transport
MAGAAQEHANYCRDLERSESGCALAIRVATVTRGELMKLCRTELSDAVRVALSLGAVVAVGLSMPVFAQEQTSGEQAGAGANPAAAQTLKAVVVTGSRIRRVDVETSNPIVTVTPELIQQTGSVTLGDVVQSLPSITGTNSSPNINNAAGDGAVRLGLRGLGPNRTLVLVDGQRVISNDLNAIPASAVDHIEVLTSGASSIYGSDAIGGVINVLLKSNYQGAQLQLNDGISSRGDGKTRGGNFVFGQTTDTGSVMAGVDYNKIDAIPETARDVSKNTVSISGSTNTPPHVFFGGSSFTPRGSIVLPKSLQGEFGCKTVSLNPSAVGSSGPTTLADYHCFNPETDRFSFSPYRPLTTPQERTSAFFKGLYHVTSNIDATLTYTHNKTSSGFQLGPPVWGNNVGALLSKDSIYNPFGIDYTPTNGNIFRSRLVPMGNRFTAITTTTDQVNFAVKGNLTVFDQDWTWDAGYNFGHISQDRSVRGLANLDVLNPGLGPSMFINGVPTCVGTAGDPSTAIAGCTPWDTFNLNNPASEQVQASATSPAGNSLMSLERVKHVDVSGGLIDLPAGTAQLALGASWRSEYTTSKVDPVLLINDLGTCTFSSQCSSPLHGGFSVKEAYGELFVPVLKELPLVYSLNLDVGDRYSKFSDFGSTSNWKVGIEYRPIRDLLLRGTVAKVFRAPTIGNLFAAPGAFGQVINADPCDHATVANAACVGVPLDGTFVNQQVASHQQTNVLSSGSAFAGFPLKPEQGKSFDFGAVYSPDYLPGFSASVDAWRIYLKDVITNVSGQTVLSACFNGVSQFCPLIQRFGADTENPGQFIRMLLPTVNLGRVDVSGTDLQATYRLPELPFGQFVASVQATYLTRYDLETAPGLEGNQVIHQAGNINYDTDNSLMPRVQGLANLTWNLGSWNAAWRIRYMGPFNLGSHDPSRGYSGIPGFKPDNPQVLRYGAYIYNDVSAGYEIKAINTRIDVGVNNLTDKQPPMLYENNGGAGNGNTATNYFDPIGRFYWARLTYTF